MIENTFDPQIKDIFKQEKSSLLNRETPLNTHKSSYLTKSDLKPTNLTQTFIEKPKEVNIILIEILDCKKCSEYENLLKTLKISK